jgi:predicted HD superfamily hydrolase involved in NAD metabolism
MWNEEAIIDYLHINLREKRLAHSVSVSKTAVALAEKYGEDIEKARIAGLVHDCAKDMKDEHLIKLAIDHGIVIDEVCLNSPTILHGLVGSIIAREVMGIEDEDILRAICYHTTGRKNMSTLEKIIYIADYIEPLRNFPGVSEVRTLCNLDLDAAVLMSLESSIIYVIDQKELLHTDTIDARNCLINKHGR